MEFLVRLEDKVNTQTWCYNPIHNGDKVVFYDDTFKAKCLLCNEDKFLYRKNDAITKKGHLITYKSDGWSWGSNELKHYGIVRIACTDEEAAAWCAGIIIPIDPAKTNNENKIAKLEDRPRKFVFDYEAVVPKDRDWEDKEKDSKIFELTDTTYIKDKSITVITEKDI